MIGVDLKHIFDLYHSMDQDTLSFFYQGTFNDEITDKIIGLSEYSISSHQDQAKMSSKVSFLMAECFQNIVRHGASIEQGRAYLGQNGMFITRHIGASYYITSCNLVERKSIDFLREKIEQINHLDKDELKKLYLDNLEHEGLSVRGGAGLGLIEMARKSGQKLEYLFEPFDDRFTNFYLQIKMKSHIVGDELIVNTEIPIEKAVEYHHQMLQNSFMVIHRGDFSQESVIPILRMLENNLRNQFELFKNKKRAFHMLVEVLQNVSKHSFLVNGMHKGIFTLGIVDDKYIINTGNYIAVKEATKLKSHLDRLNEMNREELTELYKVTLRAGKSTQRGGAGLGIIDIARESPDKLSYLFIPIDQEKSFFLLSTSVQ